MTKITKIAGLKCKMYRCMYDPTVGPKPMNAVVPESMGDTAYVNDGETGVIHLKANGQIRFVPFTNIQTTELERPTEQELTQSDKIDKRTKEYKAAQQN